MKVRHLHFVGIKGVGMTPLAILAKEAGIMVTGCDVEDSFITDEPLKKSQIPVSVGFSKEHLAGVDLVITTGAHNGYSNLEVVAAKENNIPILTQGQAVGSFMTGSLFNKKQKGISVSGCHGKTTTTAMIATIFTSAKLDPSFIIGTSKIPSLSFPGHFGNGDYFISEADEYVNEPKFDKTPKFIFQHPNILLVTNIEFDHPDVYLNINEVINAYKAFIKNLREKDILIINGDDFNSLKLLENYRGKVIKFGINSSNDYVLYDCRLEENFMKFSVSHKGQEVGEFKSYAIGIHNGLNALAAIVVSIIAGISILEVKEGLLAFRGTKRRFEYKGKLLSGSLVYDDYAHHPTEIKETLKAFRLLFPNKKIVCIFQPHTFSRTKLLFEEFKYSFKLSDEVLVTNIYASKREAQDTSVSSKSLVEALQSQNVKALFMDSFDDVLKYIQEKALKNDYVFITMGAGDIYKISEKLDLKK